jgi:hypothetical protein
LHCKYHFEKWYWEKVKEEMAWEEEVMEETRIVEETSGAD